MATTADELRIAEIPTDVEAVEEGTMVEVTLF